MKKILIVIIVIYSIALISCRNDIVLTSQAWSYDKGICTAEFSIKNNKGQDEIRIIRITAHRLEIISYGGIVDTVIGEKTFYMGLKPGEEKKWTGTIELFPNICPNTVIISHFKTNR